MCHRLPDNLRNRLLTSDEMRDGLECGPLAVPITSQRQIYPDRNPVPIDRITLSWDRHH